MLIVSFACFDVRSFVNCVSLLRRPRHGAKSSCYHTNRERRAGDVKVKRKNILTVTVSRVETTDFYLISL